MALVETTKSAVIDRESRPYSLLSVKNVLFATDFSLTSEAALPYAAAICRRFGSTLHTVHVLSDASLMMMTGGVDYVSMGTIYEDAHAEAKQRLDQISERVEGISHHNYVRHGQVWKSLCGVIHENEIDLGGGRYSRAHGLGKVAARFRGRGHFAAFSLPGSHRWTKSFWTREIARVSTTGGRDLAPPELELRQILFATNFARNSALAAQDATALAAEFHARLILMHVIEDYTRLGSDPGTDRRKSPPPAGTDSEECPIAIQPGAGAGIRARTGSHPENRGRA